MIILQNSKEKPKLKQWQEQAMIDIDTIRAWAHYECGVLSQEEECEECGASRCEDWKIYYVCTNCDDASFNESDLKKALSHAWACSRGMIR